MWIVFVFILIGLIHLLPIAPAFMPGALTRLYGVAPDDTTLLILLRHRAVLFGIIAGLCFWAAAEPAIRPASLFVAGASIMSFLVYYSAYGCPPGALRLVAAVDLLALLPLGFALWAVFWR